MPRSPIVLALLTCVAFPASAPAQGLYEPFPEPAPSPRAAGYLDRLGVKVSAGDLAHGRFVTARGLSGVAPSPSVRPVHAASTRSGLGSSEGIVLVAALSAVLAAGGLLTLRPRR